MSLISLIRRRFSRRQPCPPSRLTGWTTSPSKLLRSSCLLRRQEGSASTFLLLSLINSSANRRSTLHLDRLFLFLSYLVYEGYMPNSAQKNVRYRGSAVCGRSSICV